MDKYLQIHPEVQAALNSGRPVVALESTIIAHGMPWPKNMETALEVERIIRSAGAIPATIFIYNHKLCVGIEQDQMEAIAQNTDRVVKVSRRDIPYAIFSGGMGATTVATTMIAAEKVGIKVFVTGGIGGVHRDFVKSLDVSADLQELAKTDVAVVCAGIKSILHLDFTMEYLETHGVPVIGFKTSKLPAFYTSKSKVDVPIRMDDTESIASFLKTKWGLKLKGGVVIACSVPENYQLKPSEINEYINEALKMADNACIQGKDITPFVLKTIEELSGGRSLETNVHLIYNNAQIGAEIATALANQKSD